jgi:hypothetical protein
VRQPERLYDDPSEGISGIRSFALFDIVDFFWTTHPLDNEVAGHGPTHFLDVDAVGWYNLVGTAKRSLELFLTEAESLKEMSDADFDKKIQALHDDRSVALPKMLSESGLPAVLDFVEENADSLKKMSDSDFVDTIRDLYDKRNLGNLQELQKNGSEDMDFLFSDKYPLTATPSQHFQPIQVAVLTFIDIQLLPFIKARYFAYSAREVANQSELSFGGFFYRSCGFKCKSLSGRIEHDEAVCVGSSQVRNSGSHVWQSLESMGSYVSLLRQSDVDGFGQRLFSLGTANARSVGEK